MTDIVDFDNPMTRIVRQFEEKLATQQLELDQAREREARVNGTRDMLILLLTDMGGQVAALGAQVKQMANNIENLLGKL